MSRIKRIAVTGGAGQIAYNILFRIASGDLLGKHQPIALHILETEVGLPFLRGVVMELEDCAFPLLEEIHIGTDPNKVFQDVDYAFLIGAKPRGPGMERKDLLQENAKIFVEQGQALNKMANEKVLVLVVGNPCNTNCLIAQSFAERIDPNRFFAMTRLDQNRAVAFLAKKAGALAKNVSCMTIWGNHSVTQVPDYWHAKIEGQPVTERLVKEASWLEDTFCSLVQNRGAEIIATRGKSSAASAASAAIDAMSSLILPTLEGTWISMGVSAKGNPYGIDETLIFSFPCLSKGEGKITFVSGLYMPPPLLEKLKKTEKELQEEKQMVLFLLGTYR